MRLVSGDRKQPPRSSWPQVGLVTCGQLPLADDDTRRLIAPLAALGVAAVPAVWDDPAVDWALFDLAVVRSCWDYVPRRDEFLAWAARVTHIANPAAVLSWNTHKRYLKDLAAVGIPVVPTIWLEPAQDWTPPVSGDWVIKPAVSMASLDAGRYRMDDPDQRRLAVAHVHRLQADGRAVMVQPYLRGVDDEGETALVYIGGVFSHAMRKAAVLTGPDVGLDRRFQPQGGLELRSCQATALERLTADQVLAAVPGGGSQLLYARVDLVRDQSGRPVLMELELTEPQLYFGAASGTAEWMAAAIRKRVMAARLRTDAAFRS
jgi:hypothetical protein